MSTEVFHPSSSCPLCRNTVDTSFGGLNGQLVCPYCHARLVVSGHGQFVRDPFNRAQLISIQQLRRQSSPLARLMRDVKTPLRAIIGGMAILIIGNLAWANLVEQPSQEPYSGSTTSIEQNHP